MTNRRVHASYDGMQIVRYDRAGKWYLEPLDTRMKRQKVTVEEAAKQAVWGVAFANGKINHGLSGGLTFDRLVERLVRAQK